MRVRQCPTCSGYECLVTMSVPQIGRTADEGGRGATLALEQNGTERTIPSSPSVGTELHCDLVKTLLLSILSIVAAPARAQDALPPTSLATVTMAELSPPKYPALALHARIMGDVKLEVTISPNGVVETAVALDGHPMLTAAALDSARKTLFLCKECASGPTHYRMIYEFKLGEAEACGVNTAVEASDRAVEPQVTHSGETVTVVGHPIAICDPSFRVENVRAAKCLYLWHCAKRYPL